MLVSRSRDKLDALRQEIEGAGGIAFVYPADLSDLERVRRDDQAGPTRPWAGGHPDQQRRALDQAVDRSVLRQVPRLPAHDAAETIFGAVKLLLAVLPDMRRRRRGHIINISSIGVQAFPPRFGAYVASKSALAALSRCIAPEVVDDAGHHQHPHAARADAH